MSHSMHAEDNFQEPVSQSCVLRIEVGCQAWRQALLPTEQASQPNFTHFKNLAQPPTL